MTDELETALRFDTEAAVVAELAQAATAPHVLEPGQIYGARNSEGHLIYTDTDDYRDNPRRVVESRTVSNAESFVKYLEKHGLPQTEVYADVNNSRLFAIIDSHHGANQPAGWNSHQLRLALEYSKPWLAWTNCDGKWFDQTEFAEFIELRAHDIQDPSHASIIELALKFEAKKNVDFKQSTRLESGEVQFVYEETVTAQKGVKGSIEVPKGFQLAIKPYIGGPSYFIFAHFRYRITPNGLKLAYQLERPQEVLDSAFTDIVTEVRDGKTTIQKDGSSEFVHAGIGETPIFYGRP
ncbi:MAG: DUF2303 family protein [Microbacteriaceae bacterium]